MAVKMMSKTISKLIQWEYKFKWSPFSVSRVALTTAIMTGTAKGKTFGSTTAKIKGQRHTTFLRRWFFLYRWLVSDPPPCLLVGLVFVTLNHAKP